MHVRIWDHDLLSWNASFILGLTIQYSSSVNDARLVNAALNMSYHATRGTALTCWKLPWSPLRLLTERSAKLNGSWSTGGWHDVELMQAQPSRLNQNSSKLVPRYGTTERAARMLFWHCVDHGIKERPLLLENSSWWLLGLLKHSIAFFRKSKRVAWKEVV